MSKNASLTIRMDNELKSEAQRLFNNLGMDMSTAINVFLSQAVRYQGFPFELTLNTPNADTMLAIQEVQELKQNPDKKTYASFDDILKELDEDE